MPGLNAHGNTIGAYLSADTITITVNCGFLLTVTDQKLRASSSCLVLLFFLFYHLSGPSTNGLWNLASTHIATLTLTYTTL